MRFLFAVAVFAVVWPLASADSVLDAGPGHVRLERDDPAPCLAVSQLPCLAWYDSGTDPGTGDDSVHLEEMLRAIDVSVDAPNGGGLAERIDLRNTSIPVPIFQDIHAIHSIETSVVPAEVRRSADFDTAPEGIVFHTPQVDLYRGTVSTGETTTWEWSDDQVNYTSVHAPFTTYLDSSDINLDDVAHTLSFCQLTYAVGDALCPLTASAGLIRAVEAATPNVVFGAEVDQVRAAVNPPASDPQGLFERSVGERGDEPSFVTSAFHDHPSDVRTPHGASRVTSWAEPAGPQSAAAANQDLVASSVLLSSDAPALPAWVAALVASPMLALGYALYHRITGRRAADHPVRKRILDLVREHPGCDMAFLAAQVQRSFKGTKHHVEVLRRGNYVRVERRARRYILFVAGDEERAARASTLAHPRRHQVARLVAASPGIRLADLARSMGMNRSAVHRHVVFLVDAGVLLRTGSRIHPVLDAVPMSVFDRVAPRHVPGPEDAPGALVP